MGQWKKPLLIGVFVAASLALALGWFALKRYRQESSAQPPKPWNPSAIKSSFAGVQVREMDAANAVLVFYYDLENTTDFDYRLESGPNLVLMSRLKSNGSLSSEKPIKLSYPAFVPARSRARVALEIARPFAWPTRTDAASQGKFRELVNGEVANLKGFVLFDGATRYQIELPGAWQEARQIPAGTAPN
jgi:hypothetical protein